MKLKPKLKLKLKNHSYHTTEYNEIMSSDEKVRQILKTLSKSRTFLGKARNEALSEFGEWVFQKKPHFEEETMKLLLLGHGSNSEYPEGLFHLCGAIKESENDKNSKTPTSSANGLSVGTLEYSRSLHDVIQGTNKRFKRSATVALQLLGELSTQQNPLLRNTTQTFKNIVANALDYDTLLKAKLDLHMLSGIFPFAFFFCLC